MKKIFLCMAAMLVLMSCNNRSDKQEDGTAAGAETNQSEMLASGEEVEGQEGWIKQTTIMTNKPMVVDFYATWCGPCKQLAPILDEIEKNHKGEVIFKRVDVDQEPDLAMEFRVEANPMLLFITPKGEYQSIMGLQEPQVIETKIAELLKRSGK
jgi:thioredoxin